MTEICVLSDVLNIVRDKKYMVLDPMTQTQPTPKPVMSLLAKKKVGIKVGNSVLKQAASLDSVNSEIQVQH